MDISSRDGLAAFRRQTSVWGCILAVQVPEKSATCEVIPIRLCKQSLLNSGSSKPGSMLLTLHQLAQWIYQLRPPSAKRNKYLYCRRVSYVLLEATHARLGRKEVVLPL